MKKNIREAVKSGEADKLRSVFLDPSCINIVYPNLRGRPDHNNLWVGEYLLSLFIAAKITRERLQTILELKTEGDDTWLLINTCHDNKTALGVINLIQAFAEKKILPPQLLLQFLFAQNKIGWSCFSVITKHYPALFEPLAEMVNELVEQCDVTVPITNYLNQEIKSDTIGHFIIESNPQKGNFAMLCALLISWITIGKLDPKAALDFIIRDNAVKHNLVDWSIQQGTPAEFCQIIEVVKAILAKNPKLLIDVLRVFDYRSENTSVIQKLFVQAHSSLSTALAHKSLLKLNLKPDETSQLTLHEAKISLHMPLMNYRYIDQFFEGMIEANTQQIGPICKIFLFNIIQHLKKNVLFLFPKLIQKLLLILVNDFYSLKSPEIAFLRHFFLSKNGLQNLMVVARYGTDVELIATLEIISKLLSPGLTTESHKLFKELKREKSQQEMSEFVQKEREEYDQLAEDFTLQLLSHRQSGWSLHHTAARYQDVSVDHLMQFTDRCINRLNTILTNRKHDSEDTLRAITILAQEQKEKLKVDEKLKAIEELPLEQREKLKANCIQKIERVNQQLKELHSWGATMLEEVQGQTYLVDLFIHSEHYSTLLNF